ncbi:beta-N-acetylhexosaminidase [Oligella ureolytica]|nr:beta-N-acetylhexosaminidase [Alcaligenaceae bacterium]HZJ97323.1 beta-N-acetylhexosaminidase [Oligella sp.]
MSSNNKNSTMSLGPVMVDVEGLCLQNHEIERLKNPLVGAVILFARNYQDPKQLTELCRQIHGVRDEPLLIAIDHEGGRVQRCRTDGFTHLPAMAELGELWDDNQELAVGLAHEVGYVLAAELLSCGVDFSFTPVLDLDYGVSEVIGNRAFHRDPEVVATLSEALIDGLAEAGMAACGKHFPGHGFVEADSHVAIPVDSREFDEIWAEDIQPYVALGHLKLPSLMPAHVIYEKVDPMPAGFSKFWIQELLRERMGYQGMVFSDDLTMEGASVVGGIVERANAAFTAGCDMVLVCNRPDLADELLGQLEHQSSEESIQRLKNLVPKEFSMNWQQLHNEPRYVKARQALEQLGSKTC